MTDFEKAKKIYARMAEHLVPVMKSGMEWVGLFLQGSQNYDLDYEGSDIDTKVIVLPSFTDFYLIVSQLAPPISWRIMST